MKVGDWVCTPDKKPSGKGVVENLSECGRYARVRKQYGSKSWVKLYGVKELKVFAKGKEE